ncbi:MAG: hypothetical protein JJU01_03715 [Alkalibacterium sp.]|nr:hypothetical protein [Alkalibacterium sp.]
MRARRPLHLISDEGSSLMSTLLLLVFLTVIITSVTGVVKHQIHQYRQTDYSYEAKTLIEMAEVVLLEAEIKDQRFPEKIVFSTGSVTVSRISPSIFQLEAVLHNQYTSKKQVSVDAESTEEVTEEMTLENKTNQREEDDFKED